MMHNTTSVPSAIIEYTKQIIFNMYKRAEVYATLTANCFVSMFNFI